MLETLDDFENQYRAIDEACNIDLVHTGLLASDDSQQTVEELSAEIDIQAAFDEIRFLKSHLVRLWSVESVLQQLQLDKTIETVATAKESARLDCSLLETKKSLRAVKRARADADKQLPNLVQDVVSGLRVRDVTAGHIRQHLHKRRATVRAREVQSAISQRDLPVIEDMVDHIDEVDSKICGDLIRLLREEKASASKNASQSRARVEELRRDVENLEAAVTVRDERMMELQSRITTVDSIVENAPSIRNDILLERRLASTLRAVSGVAVREVRGGGLSLSINAGMFARLPRQIPRNYMTHSLDIEFGCDSNNKSDISEVYDVMLNPRDVSLNLRNSKFEWATRVTLSALRIFMEQKYQSSI